MRRASWCLGAVFVLAGCHSKRQEPAAPPDQPSEEPPSSADTTAKLPTCDDVGDKAAELAREARKSERRAPSTLFGQVAPPPSKEDQAREETRRDCLDQQWPQELISCVVAASSVESARACIAKASGETAGAKPPICQGIANALAAAPTFDSIKGAKLELDPVHAASLNKWATTNEVPGTEHCAIAEVKGLRRLSFYCVIAQGPSDDARARAVFEQAVAQIDTCDRPPEWSKFVHQPDRFDKITKTVTAAKWRPPGDKPALGVELRLTTVPESSTTYRLRVDVGELSNTK